MVNQSYKGKGSGKKETEENEFIAANFLSQKINIDSIYIRNEKLSENTQQNKRTEIKVCEEGRFDTDWGKFCVRKNSQNYTLHQGG